MSGDGVHVLRYPLGAPDLRREIIKACVLLLLLLLLLLFCQRVMINAKPSSQLAHEPERPPMV
jgi:hypothetical protein